MLRHAGAGQHRDRCRSSSPLSGDQSPDLRAGLQLTGFYLGFNGAAARLGISDWRFDLRAPPRPDCWLQLASRRLRARSGRRYRLTNIKGHTFVFCAPVGPRPASPTATVRGRVGYTFDRFMPYVTGGLAIGDIRAHAATWPDDHLNFGWTVGTGFETACPGPDRKADISRRPGDTPAVWLRLRPAITRRFDPTSCVTQLPLDPLGTKHRSAPGIARGLFVCYVANSLTPAAAPWPRRTAHARRNCRARQRAADGSCATRP